MDQRNALQPDGGGPGPSRAGLRASYGDHAEIAATASGRNGRAFVKAAPAGAASGRSLRYELAATEAVGRYSYPPAVLWSFEAEGWLVMGTEPLEGRPPELSPGSPDLDLFAATVTDLQKTVAPDGRWFSADGRCGFHHPAMDGEMLVHSDLNPTNVMVTADGLRIVDWAFMTRAASWVELALLMPWLIGGGHSPAQAEGWLEQFPAWTGADREAVDDFAVRNAAKWSARAQPGAATWMRDLAAWTTEWATYRHTGR